MYLGPTSTKAVSFDSDGNVTMPAGLTVAGKAIYADTIQYDHN